MSEERVAVLHGQLINNSHHVWFFHRPINNRIIFSGVSGGKERQTRALWNKHILPIVTELRLLGYEVIVPEGVEP